MGLRVGNTNDLDFKITTPVYGPGNIIANLQNNAGYEVLNEADFTGNGTTVFGGDGIAVPVGIGNQGIQVKGDLPFISLHETDADPNKKTWSITASAGSLHSRIINDSGVATIYQSIYTNNSGGISFQDFMHPIKARLFSGSTDPTTAQLPTNGQWLIWQNTTNNEIRIFANQGGVIRKSAPFT